jgi:hypothetical protein
MCAVFRLREAIAALRPTSEESLTIFTVPRDVVLQVIGEPETSGLVELLWEGRRIKAFMQDIESRGELIEVAKAAMA